MCSEWSVKSTGSKPFLLPRRVESQYINMCKTHEDTQRAEIVKAQNKRWYEGFKFLFIILLEISSYEKYKARINMVFICGILSLICITICVMHLNTFISIYF